MAISTRLSSIRRMTVGDLPEVIRIEKESFTPAWPQTLYKRELEHNQMARYLVAECPPESEVAGAATGSWRNQVRRWFGNEPEPADPPVVVGFVGVWFMAGEGHVVTIAVALPFRRQGLGEMLLIAAIDVSIAHHQDAMSLECRVSNTTAQSLYEKYGFYRTGLRPRYYSDNHEDALIMTTESLRGAPYQARLGALRREYEERWGAHQRSPDMLD